MSPGSSPSSRDRRPGPAADRGLLVVAAFGVLTGLWGLGWGLPGRERVDALPAGMALDSETARRVTEAWKELYQGIERAHRELAPEEPVTHIVGVEEVPPGWSWPPGQLLNSYRSLLLRSEDPDEQKVFVELSRMRPWKLQLQPLYIHYGGSFLYPLGAFLKAASWVGAARLVPDMSHYLLHPEQMGRLFLLGRLFVFLAHLGSLLLLFDIGRRLTNPTAGVVAALLFGLCPLVLAYSHVAKPHAYTSLWTLAAVRFMLLAFDKGAASSYLWSGACAGMAAGSNFSYGCVLGLPALAWLWRRAQGRAGRGEAAGLSKGLAAGIAVAAAANPYFVFSPGDYLWETTVLAGGAGSQSWGRKALSIFGLPATSVLGAGTYGLILLGAAGAFRARAPVRALGAASAACFAVLWVALNRLGGAWLFEPAAIRFFYPLVGLGALLAADLLYREGFPRPLRLVLLSAAFADGGLRAWVVLENMRLDSTARSTRARAADWVHRNIEPGASLGLDRYPQPANSAPVRYERYRLVIFQTPDLLDERGLRPEYILVDGRGKSAVERWRGEAYEPLASIEPYTLGWAGVDAGLTTANASFHLYRRAARGGS